MPACVTSSDVRAAATAVQFAPMSDVNRYLCEEVGIDHADGHITRREAMRRLSLLGLSVAAATTLLAACSKDPAAPSAGGAAGGGGGNGTAGGGGSGGGSGGGAGGSVSGGLPTTAITFPGAEGRTLQGAFATHAAPTGSILVIHENKGLLDHHRSVAGRFAEKGYAALAIDLLSAEGGTASLGDAANATAALGKITPERFVADMRSGLDELAKRTPGKKLGVIGFCFGGGMSWRLAAAKDPRLAAAVPFYGPLPEGADFTGTNTAVLGVFAEKDTRVNASLEAAKAALAKAGVPHEIVVYPGVDHAFFNDTGPRYDATQASAAFVKSLDWFGKYLA